jgi:hypothetical protein
LALCVAFVAVRAALVFLFSLLLLYRLFFLFSAPLGNSLALVCGFNKVLMFQKKKSLVVLI